MSNELAKRIEAFLSRVTPLRSSQGNTGLAVGSIKGPREDNQDRVAVAYFGFPSGEGVLVGLVCDGMGGMVQGGEAAGCAASTFLGGMVAASGRPLRNTLFECVAAANREVYRRFRGAGGTTLTALAVTNAGEAWAAHVGDSRLYEIAHDRLPHLITRDDTIGGQLRTPDSTADDMLDNRLLQFVGIGASIEPHILRVQSGQGRSFLLTTDGAHSIGKRALEGVVRTSGNVPEIVRKVLLVAEAIGVDDNCSAVAIMGSEFERPKNYTGGTEVTVWSPGEKLEMWLGAPSTPQVSPAREREASLQGAAVEEKKVSPTKQKKPARAKSKQAKKSEGHSEPSPDTEKPQLNIEFGSRNEGTK
ncbi:PP2C family protein-serine/threonine phosphatase [Rhizobium acaciae]|uniref:PP2C family protein-serine/threonine phosphatase n=1 Tax=Rhizobium acaciae TaxID=2989736 RepID=UPI0022209F36|nr:protein phosphatase 2C domain-containing protein [Rhizobium acaciae]MCW1752979.1 protein phosphatase 2C domain-containing protein [Rhizobium acaciae]